jgi:Dockerin type I domain
MTPVTSSSGYAVAAALTLVCAMASAQTDPVTGILGMLSSTVLATREGGFASAMALGASKLPAPINSAFVPQETSALLSSYPTDAANISTALIAALGFELASSETGQEEPNASNIDVDTSYGSYFGDLVTAVVALNDPRSQSSLVALLFTGNMVIDRVVSFGATSVDPVTNTVYSLRPEVRDAAILTMTRMLAPQNRTLFGDVVSQSKIRAGLKLAKLKATLPDAVAEAQSGLKVLPAVAAGDLNGDGAVNCADLAIIKASFGKRVGQTGFDIRADVNGDGVVNIIDLSTEARGMPAGTVCN